MNNPRGFVLRDFSSAKNFKILVPPGSTYWPSSLRKKPDIFDIFIMKIPSSAQLITFLILILIIRQSY